MNGVFLNANYANYTNYYINDNKTQKKHNCCKKTIVNRRGNSNEQIFQTKTAVNTSLRGAERRSNPEKNNDGLLRSSQ